MTVVAQGYRTTSLTFSVESGKHYMLVLTVVSSPVSISSVSGGTLLFQALCNWTTSADGNPTVGIIEANSSSVTMTFSGQARYMWFAFND